MNQKNQAESNSAPLQQMAFSGLGKVLGQVGCLLVVIVGVALPFMPTWLQVLVFLSPLLLIALGVWWHRRREKLKVTSQASNEEAQV